MSLTSKNHRQIHYALMVVNVIGITLLFAIIILTYFKNNISDSCPKYSQADVEELKDEYGPYYAVPGLVSVFQFYQRRFLCLGTLIDSSFVLVSYECVQYVDTEYLVVKLYNESSVNLFKPEFNFEHGIGIIDECIISPYNNVALLRLKVPYDKNVNLLNLPYINDKCNVTGDATLLWYNKKLFKSDVLIEPATECTESYIEFLHKTNYFCTKNKEHSNGTDTYKYGTVLMNTVTNADGNKKQVITGFSYNPKWININKPLMHTKVETVSAWIEQKIKDIKIHREG